LATDSVLGKLGKFSFLMRRYSSNSPVHNKLFPSLIVLALFVQEKVQKA